MVNETTISHETTDEEKVPRIALVGIIVQDVESVKQLNAILHEHRMFIIGRMGVPCPSKNLSIISVAVNAPTDVISALAGKVGMLEGVSSKTVYPKLDS